MQVSSHKEQEPCFVLWSDCMTRSGQLSRTCQWPSIPKRQILPFITMAGKTLQRARSPMHRLPASSQDTTRKPGCYWFRKLLLLQRWGLLPAPQCPLRVPGSLWQTEGRWQPASCELTAASLAHCAPAHLWLLQNHLCLFCLIFLIKIPPRGMIGISE